MPLCCMNRRKENYIGNESDRIKRLLPRNKDEQTYKIIKIQSCIRGFLSQKLLDSLYNSTKTQISKELEQKKLINESRIFSCESYLIYNKLISDKKIISFSELLKNNQELNSLYSKISKYSFIVPNYIVTSPNEVYKGSWNINKRYHGHGIKFQFNDKKTKNKRIEGIFLNGFLYGHGIVICSNGEIISGNFIKNNINGDGEHIRADQSIYKGQFKNGKYNGMGREIFPDGNYFEGFFSDGVKKYGTYEFKNGSKYNGEFLNNVFHGKGKYIWPNKKEYDGIWRDGKMNGKGKFTYLDGSYYEGGFQDGKKSGHGKYIWKKDRYYEGMWKNDKQNGHGIYFDRYKIIKGIWIDGKISNKKKGIIKRSNTFLKLIKHRNESPIKKGITQEYFYRRNNLTDKEKNNKILNFNPTANGKCIRNICRNHFNFNSNKFSQNSMYSIESTNTIKSNNNHVDSKTSNFD